MLLHPLNNFEIQKHQNEPKFNGVYSRNSLPKIKDGYVVNLDEDKGIRIHGIALYINGDQVTYFDRFGDQFIPKEV